MGKRTKIKKASSGEAKEKKSYDLLIPKDTFSYNNLTFIRSLLAVLILYSHCFLIFHGTKEEVEPLFVWSGGQMSWSELALNFFFAISGFLILLNFQKRKNTLNYLKKRFLRIYPAFIVVSLLCLFVFGPLGTADYFRPFGYWKLYYQNIDWAAVPINILTLQEPHAPWVFKYAPVANSLNAPLWTIKYELLCYLLIVVFGFIGMYMKRAFLLIFFIELYAVHIYEVSGGMWLFNWSTVPFVGHLDQLFEFMVYFIAGMTVYNYRSKIPRYKALFYASILIVVASAVFFDGLYITLPIFGSYVVFYSSFSRSYCLKGFAMWGDFSYGIYLYSWPIQQLVLVYFEQYLDVTLLFILSFTITMIFAYGSWHLVEKRMIRLKYKFPKRKAVKNSPVRIKKMLITEPIKSD